MLLVVFETPTDQTNLAALHGDVLRGEESEGVEQPQDASLWLALQSQWEAELPGVAGGPGVQWGNVITGVRGTVHVGVRNKGCVLRVWLSDQLRAEESRVSPVGGQLVKSQLQGNSPTVREGFVRVGPGYLNPLILPGSINLHQYSLFHSKSSLGQTLWTHIRTPVLMGLNIPQRSKNVHSCVPFKA